jgi:hypothetical protein
MAMQPSSARLRAAPEPSARAQLLLRRLAFWATSPTTFRPIPSTLVAAGPELEARGIVVVCSDRWIITARGHREIADLLDQEVGASTSDLTRIATELQGEP